MSENPPVRRRESFDEVAQLYEKARPAYPIELIDELATQTALGAASRVLEIGCGTGHLTVPLAQCGAPVLAVELGVNLAAIAQQKLAGFPRVNVVVADFDTWRPPAGSFDLVVAATCFHWLDPATRVRKCADLLTPGGTLAIVDTHWGVGPTRDRFSIESQACYARWDRWHDPAYLPPVLGDLPQQRRELDDSRRFESVRLSRHPCERRYSTAEYCDLLATFSTLRALDETARTGLLGCIASLIDRRFGGELVRHDLYELWLARTPADRPK